MVIGSSPLPPAERFGSEMAYGFFVDFHICFRIALSVSICNCFLLILIAKMIPKLIQNRAQNRMHIELVCCLEFVMFFAKSL